MNDVWNFLAENGWARSTLLVGFLLIVARKPTLRYFRGRMERMAAQQEISSYEILRKEIHTLNTLLVQEQTEKRALSEIIEEKEKTIHDLRNTISELTPK
jgi:hypothetical protein